MTILMFTRLFYPHIGGVEKHVFEISRKLVSMGHKVIVATEQYQKSLKEKEIVDGIEIYRIPVGKSERLKKFEIWRWMFKHQDLIKKADVVHAHDVFFWYLPFKFLYPQKRVFTTFHGYETQFPPSKKAVLLRKISEKLSKGNICVGDYIKKWYGTKTDDITYGGVKIIQNSECRMQNYHRKCGIPLRRDNSKLKILFVGRLENDTGLLIYFEVLNLLKKKKIDFEVEFCGDGSLRELAEKWGKVYGFVPDLRRYLTRSDLVFSSSYLSILQALVAKRPVFAVYQNPLKEDYLKMAPFAKWVIVSNSPKVIADKIYNLYKGYKTNIEEKIDYGYKWVKNQTWDEVVNLYLKLWRT